LFATALAWFLTSSNRYLRDSATKSLIKVLGGRSQIMLSLLRNFRDVNDPYVVERLMAIAYGCATKMSDTSELKDLANFLFSWIFNKKEPYSHILIRDYARGVIQAAVNAGAHLELDLEKTVPPYKSKWPTRIPTVKTLTAKYGWWKEGMPDTEWAREAIFSSVMGFGDFARYVIGTNSGFFGWSGTRLRKRPEQSPKEKYEAFVEGLMLEKRQAWERLQALRFQSIAFRLGHERLKIAGVGSAARRKRPLAGEIRKKERAFETRLSAKELKTYRRDALPYLLNRGDGDLLPVFGTKLSMIVANERGTVYVED